MKNKIGISAVILLTMLFTACGGGGADIAGGNNNNPSNPIDQSGKLIIDNGRGTTNNQDTERVK
jgi:hypothetical protein